MKQVKVFPLILLFILLIGNSQLSYAYPKAEQHDKKLIAVLFEPGYSIFQSDRIKNNVKAINYASYLTIDQFGEDGEKKFLYYTNINCITCYIICMWSKSLYKIS